MLLTSPAHKNPTVEIAVPSNSKNSDLANAVARGELTLSLSTMLGCDYIFVSHQGMHELLQPRHANKTIYEVLMMLDAAPRQSMVVGADQLENRTYAFTRYEYIWENRQIKKVSIIPVTNSDQIEFMQMMFDCSSSC